MPINAQSSSSSLLLFSLSFLSLLLHLVLFLGTCNRHLHRHLSESFASPCLCWGRSRLTFASGMRGDWESRSVHPPLFFFFLAVDIPIPSHLALLSRPLATTPRNATSHNSTTLLAEASNVALSAFSWLRRRTRG